MTATSQPKPAQTVRIGGAQIDLRDVHLRDDITLDEVHLEAGNVELEPGVAGKPGRIAAGETAFRALVTEENLNRLLAGSVPKDAPVGGLKIALLSGKARITGNFVKFGISVPFTLDALPRIENGVRVSLDCKDVNLVGVSLPAAVVEIVQQQLNASLSLDLTRLPVPVWLDEARCEPGRLTIVGKARLTWPLETAAPPSVAPFAARAFAGEAVETPAALSEPNRSQAVIEAGFDGTNLPEDVVRREPESDASPAESAPSSPALP